MTDPILTCSNCGRHTPHNSSFCGWCGTPVPVADGDTQFQTNVAPPLEAGTHPAWSVDAPPAPDGTILHQDYNSLPAGHPAQREHVCLCADTSGSMNESLIDRHPRIEAARDACWQFVTGKAEDDPRDMIGLVSFDESAKLITDLTRLDTGADRLLADIKRLRTGGGTNMTAGLKKAEAAFDWSLTHVVRRIVLWSDGDNNIGDPEPIADRLKQRGVVIETIGIGEREQVNEALLRSLATGDGDKSLYRFFRDSDSFTKHLTDISGKSSAAY